MEPFDILLLQETKIEEDVLLSISRTKWKKNAGKEVSARGTLGGLATLWSENKFLLKSSFATQHQIYTELRHISNKISTTLFNLYVPVNFKEKKECWNTLSNFIEIYSLSNIIMVGDLNIILEQVIFLTLNPKKVDSHGPITKQGMPISLLVLIGFLFKFP